MMPSRLSMCALLLAGAGSWALCSVWAAEPDVSKKVLEGAPQQIIAARTATTRGDDFTNPAVAPGSVKWHATFAEACAASKQSGKPVLLFQLLGKLDQKFC